MAEIDSTPLGQRLRRPGDHAPDAMRAQSGCHSHGRSYCRYGRPTWSNVGRRHGHSPPADAVTPGAGGSITLPSAAITSALRGRPAARLTMAPCRIKHEHRGCAVDPQSPYQVEPCGRVDLDVSHAVHHARHLAQDLPRRTARGAEGGRELDQRGPLAERAAEVGLGQHVRPGRRPPGSARRGTARPGGAAPARANSPRQEPRRARSTRQSRPAQHTGGIIHSQLRGGPSFKWAWRSAAPCRSP